MTHTGKMEAAVGTVAPGFGHAASRTGRRPRVALLGPYSSRNLGDTAIQLAVIEQLWSRRPDLEIVGISLDPDDTFRSLGIPAFALDGQDPPAGGLAREFRDVSPSGQGRWLTACAALRHRYAVAASLDLLIVSGGGQLDDYWGGAWGHPWALLQWTALARLHRVPVAIVGVGMDRLSTRLSRRFVATALRLASYRAFRDRDTVSGVDRLGVPQRNRLCPDLVYAKALDAQAFERSPGGPRFAVFNPVSAKTWTHQQDRVEAAAPYLLAMAEAGRWLAARGLGIRIACSQPAMDLSDAQRLCALLQERGVEDVEIVPVQQVEDYLACVGRAELVIAARLHGALLALLSGTPVVGVAHRPKVAQLMAEAGLAELCLPLHGLDAADLIDRCGQVLAQQEALRARIADTNEGFRQRLAGTFDDLVGLLA